MTEFIHEKRVEDEHLKFTFLRESGISPEELPNDIDYGVVDGAGVVYRGIIREDGTIDDAYTTWNDLDTYNRFNRRPKAIALKDAGWYRQTLFWNRDIDEFFLEHAARNQCQVSMSPVSADYVRLGSSSSTRGMKSSSPRLDTWPFAYHPSSGMKSEQ
jgi:hypothetical protein